MKNLITFFAAVIALASSASTTAVRLTKGACLVPSGKILAVQGVTISDAQGVTGTVTYAATEFTNETRTVSTPHVWYAFSVTNFDGGASIATNALDSFNGGEWLTTSGVSRVCSPVLSWSTNLTSTVTYKAQGETKTVTDVLFGGNAVGGLLKLSPNAYFVGGTISVDCGDYDSLTLLVE